MQVIINKLNEILSYIRNTDSSRYIDLKECSEYCSVSLSTLRRNILTNKLKASNTTGKTLIKVSDIEEWLNN